MTDEIEIPWLGQNSRVDRYVPSCGKKGFKIIPSESVASGLELLREVDYYPAIIVQDWIEPRMTLPARVESNADIVSYLLQEVRNIPDYCFEEGGGVPILIPYYPGARQELEKLRIDKGIYFLDMKAEGGSLDCVANKLVEILSL